jgi:PAS domain S-box-containing protein
MESFIEMSLENNDEISKIRRYAVLIAVFWTMLLSCLFAAYIVENREVVQNIGQKMAQASFEKDVLFRRWAVRHGGVYVPVTATTQANPYLADIPERDVVTPSGRRLTLINPAHITRQIFEMAREIPDLPQGHITSLKPIRPENAADPWETKALIALEHGAKEVVESVMMNGQPHLRFMRPLLTEKPCLKCHASQGYKEGDCRGGISITLSLVQIQKTMDFELMEEGFFHALVWLIGLGCIWYGARKILRMTKLLRAESAKLCESEESFRRQFADNSSVMILLDPVTGQVVDINSSAIKFYGFSREQFLAMNFTDLHASPPTGLTLPVESDIPEHGNRVEYSHRLANNSIRDMEVSTSRIQIGQRNILHLIITDITDRKLAEAGLRDSKEHYRAIVEAFDGQIYICSQDYRILFMNEKMVERSGRNAVGEFCFKALHDLEAVCPWCVSERVFGGETVKWEIQSPKDKRWYYVVNTPIHNEDGSISKQAMIQDITDRKHAEESLIKNEAKQRAMIENIVDVIAIIDRDEIVRYKSPNIEKWFGWQPEEVINRSIWNNVHPDDLANTQKLFADLLGETNALVTSECRLLCKDGNYKWIKATAINLLHNPDISGVLISYHDISERVQAEAERLGLEQQFHHAQKLESLGVLASGIAHDFNNILTVILGHCYMAKEGMIPDSAVQDSFNKIESAGNRASELCRQMMSYAGKNTQCQTRVNLWLLVDEIAKMLHSAINKNITIDLDLGCDIPEIIGDSGQLQQIVMNLIINASEAVSDAIGTVRVVLAKSELSAYSADKDVFGKTIVAGRYICLEVTDTGCGMNEETLQKIFEPFYTTKVSGRGLGMSAIRGIVKSHGGFLILDSTPGIGTTFKVYFPVPEEPIYAETIASVSVSSEKPVGTILLVEDDHALLDMGMCLLEVMGFSSITAQNGREAVETYQAHSGEIDLIILDLIMPVQGGIATYEELREIGVTIPIIICSGYGVESVADIIKHDEHAEFIHKPYNPSQLRDVMMKMTKRYKP